MWPVKNIVYVSIIGSVLFTALFEWLLWLMAFVYCFAKVIQKADDLWIRVAALIMMAIFIFLRLAFLPVVLVCLPLPAKFPRSLPSTVDAGLQWFAFSCFAIILTVPWLLCIYQLIIHSFDKRKGSEFLLDDHSAPKVVVVIPCYKEPPSVLLRTVESLTECHYPKSCLHIFLSFDGDDEDRLYLETIERLGVPLVRSSGFPISIDVVFKDIRLTISRFVHGGKRHCQKQTFKLVNTIYQEYMSYNDDIFILFIDSDCILERHCISKLMYEMELKPGSKHNMLAMTGVITCTTERSSLITLLQDLEYIHGQLFERSVESACGSVTCLPGALSILRMSAFCMLAKEYFADKAEQCDDLFDYGKCHLGEDRWLTHLFMIASEKRYQIGVTTNAYCKTEAVSTFRALLKQRRRWFLGFVTNEVCMLTDSRVWQRYPFLCLIRLAQDTIRTTGLFFFVVLIGLLTTSQEVHGLPMGFIAIAVGLNWALMVYFAATLGRWKMLLYPVLFVLGPIFDWTYIVYGVLTAGRRTWGGPRADAAQADALTTPQTAIEHALESGDDLNVIPETFRPAVGDQGLGPGVKPSRVSLQPSERLEGRFKSIQRDERQLLSVNSDGSGDARADTGIAHSLSRCPPMRSRSAEPARRGIESASIRQRNHLPRRAESLNTLMGRDVDATSSDMQRTSRDASRSRAHPPSAGSALTSLRLSQPHLELPSRIRLRNSFSRLSPKKKTANKTHEYLEYGKEAPVDQTSAAQPGHLDEDLDESASLTTVTANEIGVPMNKLFRSGGATEKGPQQL